MNQELKRCFDNQMHTANALHEGGGKRNYLTSGLGVGGMLLEVAIKTSGFMDTMRAFAIPGKAQEMHKAVMDEGGKQGLTPLQFLKMPGWHETTGNFGVHAAIVQYGFTQFTIPDITKLGVYLGMDFLLYCVTCLMHADTPNGPRRILVTSGSVASIRMSLGCMWSDTRT